MKHLSDQLEQNWIRFERCWDCDVGREYGKRYIKPILQTLPELEKSMEKLTDAALELDRALRNVERKGNWL